MRLAILFVVVVSWALPVSAQQTYTLLWDASVNADGYRVQIGASTGGTTREEAVGPATTAAILLDPGTWYIRVYAYNGQGNSDPSNEVVQTVATPPPPGNVCTTTPLEVVVATWPANKRGTPVYTSNFQIVKVVLKTKGNTVTGATFTDTRGCTKTLLR